MKYWYLLILELLYARSKVDDEMECQREESWKISSRENYHLNASREIVPGSIEAAASRSRLCARIDEFFTKPNASVLKRFYFIPSDVFSSHVFVTRHLHSARVFLIVFKSTATGNGMNLEIPISESSPFILTILTISRCSGPDPRVLLFEDTKEGLCVLKFFNDEKNVPRYRNVE